MKSNKFLSLILSLIMVITAVSAIPFSAQATSKPQGWVKTAVEDIATESIVMVTMDTDGDGKGDWVLPNAQAQTPEATAFSTTLSKDDYGFKLYLYPGSVYNLMSGKNSSAYAAIESDSNTGFEVKEWASTDFAYTTIGGHNYFIDGRTNGNTDRCVGVYVPNEGTPTWRCYKSTNLSNIANQDVVLYVWGDLPEAVDYESYCVSNYVLTHETATADEYTVVTSSTTTLATGTYVVNSTVVNENQIRVADNAEVNLILCDGASLTASKGIVCNEGTKLNIYGQSAGTGELIATASANCAAIGGEYTETTFQHKNGYITIHGGKITATGVDHTPGIGASNWSSGGMITILNGEINATAGYGAAGIGGSEYGVGGTIEIFGGTINAVGGHDGSDGIGKGHYATSTNYSIVLGNGVKLEKSTDGTSWTTSNGSAESRAKYMRSSYTPPAPSSNTTTFIYDANGGKKGPMWQDSYTVDGQVVSFNCPDIKGRDDLVSPPDGMVFDAYLINGKRYEIGSKAPITTNTVTIKLLWKKGKDSITNAEKRAAKNKVNSKLKATSDKNGITIAWGKYAKAEKIEVYAAYCEKGGKYKKVKTLKGSATSYKLTKIDGKAIKPAKAVKAYVVAYRKVGGKYQKLAKSYNLHIIGYKNKTYTNAASIKTNKDSFTVKVDKAVTIKPTLVLENKKKKAVTHVAKFRYMSTNKAVASVDKNGKVTGHKKGSCNIYVFANNGMLKSVKINVN